MEDDMEAEVITPEARELANLVRNDEDRLLAFHSLLNRKLSPLPLNALTQVVAVAAEHEREHRKTGIFKPLDIFGACVLLSVDAPA